MNEMDLRDRGGTVVLHCKSIFYLEWSKEDSAMMEQIQEWGVAELLLGNPWIM
jgi:hypothetical protein